MRHVRYALLIFVIVPTLALAQSSRDSVLVVTPSGAYYGLPASFGQPFTGDEEVGPLPLVLVEPAIACEETHGGWVSAVNNPEEIEGSIAVVSRGSCAFVTKVQAVSEAGAVAVLIHNDGRFPSDDTTVVYMAGECTPAQGCSIPAAFVSRQSGLAILEEIGAEPDTEATLYPIRITLPDCGPCASGVHDTGVDRMGVYESGYLGTFSTFDGAGFVFDDNASALFAGTVLVGIGGDVSNNPYDGQPEFETEAGMAAIALPFPAPYADFDEGYTTSYSSGDLGVLVTQRSYSHDGDPYVVVELEVENVSGGALDGVFIGIFADWDAHAYWDDLGGVNEDLDVPYVYYDSDTDEYYGVAALGVDGLSGYSTDATTADDAELWEALTTAIPPVVEPAQRAAVTGTGPYDLAAGEHVLVRFAFVGGASEAEFLEHVAAAGSVVVDAEQPVAAAESFALAPAFPNPFSSTTALTLDLQTTQAVRVVVYDVLGREVAVLHDGLLSAGEHKLVLDAARLPSGFYLARVTGHGLAATQRFTLAR